MTSAMMRRVRKLEAGMHFTLTAPADILDHPHRIAMMRAHFKRLTRVDDPAARFLAEIVLGFSDALMVDFLFFNYENDALRIAGKDEREVWEHAFPWWMAAYKREPVAVAPAFAQWIEEGFVIEMADGFALATTEDAA
jgi:hypothetical protein